MQSAAGLLEISALLIGGAFGAVAVCARFGIPSIIGYMIAGLAIGPSGLRLVAEGEALSTLGEVGVILLLFTLGLEFSFSKLIDLRRQIFGVGALQVLVTSTVATVALIALQPTSVIAAVLVGGAIAMSSTALCFKSLGGIGAGNLPQGRLAISILLFQDLAAVAFLVVHDAALGASILQGMLRFLGGAAGLVIALYLARHWLQTMARWISVTGNNELAQLLALAISLGSAIAAIAAGLSPALGAFAAGMMISEGDARNVVEREIRPFRDLLLGVFFVGVGAQLHLSSIGELWESIVLWICILLVGKWMLTSVILRASGAKRDVSWRTGLILAHGGEFGLMLVSISVASGLIDQTLGSSLLLAIGASMLPAPVLVRLAAQR